MLSSILASFASVGHTGHQMCFVLKRLVYFCTLSLLLQKVAELLTVVAEVHPKSYSWCIPKKTPELLSLMIYEAILKHKDASSTSLNTLV